jgi:hypothetical protein
MTVSAGLYFRSDHRVMFVRYRILMVEKLSLTDLIAFPLYIFPCLVFIKHFSSQLKKYSITWFKNITIPVKGKLTTRIVTKRSYFLRVFTEAFVRTPSVKKRKM